MKKINTFTAILFLPIILSGCSSSQVPVNANSQNQTLDTNQNTDRNFVPDDRFDQVSLTNLTVGNKVIVTGILNSDQSLSASRLIIDNGQLNFGQILGGENITASGQNMADGNEQNRLDFQNLTEEQRSQMIQKFQAQSGRAGNGGTVQGRGNFQSAGRLNGEILSIDSGSLILKIPDGGSKLIFVSSSTQVFRPKASVDNFQPVQ